MAAKVSKLNMARLRRSSVFSVFQLDLLRELLCVLVAFCVLTQQSLADQQEFFEDFLKREYSLVKPYRGLGFSSSSQWDLMGTAVVTPDHVRLTPDQQSRQGAVWSRIPFVLRDWELRVHFKIHGIGKKNLNGDGLAIWLTRDRMQNGPVFGNMNQFVGLGIFVDTYPNTDKTHDVSKTSNISLNPVFISCSNVAHRLSTDNHDIISIKVYQLTVERTPEEEEEEEVITVPRLDDMYQFQVDVEEEGMSGLQLFFTLLFSILGLAVLAVVGLVLYGRWKENKRKRFY
ncbi:lectin, mannose-binding 2-like b [Poecilia reticulata]|uniref:lectin, mannose-binding 2-like b n=1 Tax=Poecilia reticulata TaxID=8081 RepID=UPI0007EC0041|nr:PREDICTED: VIP36-like protein [Poecilia reticulata]